MKKFLITMFCCVVFGTILNAQDVVYLNNGNILNGKVIQNSDNVVIVTKDNDTLTYRNTDVRKVQINNEQVNVPEASKRSEYQDYATKEKGWWCSVEIAGGGNMSIGEKRLGLCQVEFINGYRFSELIKIGLGVSTRFYMNNDYVRAPKNNRNLPFAVPVFLNVRGNFISQGTRMFSPYWSFDVGYCINDNFFYRPTIGFRIGQSRNNFIFGISYMGQILNKQKVGNTYESFLMGSIGYEF